MANIKYPASCGFLSEEEQYRVTGGGPFWDAVDTFFENLTMGDVLWSGSFLALSFTFVPSLLFNVVKSAFDFILNTVNNIAVLMGTTTPQLVNDTLLKSSSSS
ncbi:MAG: hypothetical protein ACI4LE_09000 [Faecalibacterium sp.]